MSQDDGPDRVDGPGGEVGDDRADEGRRRPLRRLLVGALGTTVALAGLAGAGALGVAGLGGLDVVVGAAPASAVDDEAPRPTPTATPDPYLAGLVGEGPEPPAPPLPTSEPLPPLAPEDDGRVVAYDVPDLDAAWAAALPSGLVVMSPGVQYRFSPTVPGQSCNGDDGVDPVAGRQWSWAEEDSNRFDQLTVRVVVTGWAEGTGEEAFDDARLDRADCSWLGDVPVEVALDAPAAEEAWAGVRPVGDEDFVHGVARTGDLLVGVEVGGVARGEGAALEGRLLDEVVLALRAADPGGAS